ncbi:MAG: hypothetical protein ACTS1Z_14475 [Parasphingopyxis sp.]|uniref:hypothetical protein n=1 Tax=Parasphingopyxis sp. TaxID=1920299 RepID=UPI003F9F1EBA
MAETLKLNPHTICDWENGKKSIGHPRYYPRIIAWLGYDPLPAPQSDGEARRQERWRLGLTSQEMADQLGIDQSTLLKREKP